MRNLSYLPESLKKHGVTMGFDEIKSIDSLMRNLSKPNEAYFFIVAYVENLMSSKDHDFLSRKFLSPTIHLDFVKSKIKNLDSQFIKAIFKEIVDPYVLWCNVIEKQQYSATKFLLDYVDPLALNINGETPLSIALKKGESYIVKTMIDKLPEHNGEHSANLIKTLLNLVIKSQMPFDKLKAVEKLLKLINIQGSSIELAEPFENGQTLLDKAIESRNCEIIQLLVENNIGNPFDPPAKERNKQETSSTLLSCAIKNGRYEIADALLTGLKNKMKSNKLDDSLEARHIIDALSGSVAASKRSLVEKILDLLSEDRRNEVLNMSDNSGRFLLEIAMCGRNDDDNENLIKLLVENGANPVMKYSEGTKKTAFSQALDKGYYDLAEIMFSYGEEHEGPNITYGDLLKVVAKDKIKLAKQIINISNANTLRSALNEYKFKDKTALQMAMENENEELAIMLVEHGSSPFIACFSKDKINTLSQAIDKGYYNLVETIIQHKDEHNPTELINLKDLSTLVYENKTHLFKRIINEISEDSLHRVINTPLSKYGKTVLQISVDNKNKEITQLLIKYGAQFVAVEQLKASLNFDPKNNESPDEVHLIKNKFYEYVDPLQKNNKLSENEIFEQIAGLLILIKKGNIEAMALFAELLLVPSLNPIKDSLLSSNGFGDHVSTSLAIEIYETLASSSVQLDKTYYQVKVDLIKNAVTEQTLFNALDVALNDPLHCNEAERIIHRIASGEEHKLVQIAKQLQNIICEAKLTSCENAKQPSNMDSIKQTRLQGDNFDPQWQTQKGLYPNLGAENEMFGQQTQEKNFVPSAPPFENKQEASSSFSLNPYGTFYTPHDYPYVLPKTSKKDESQLVHSDPTSASIPSRRYY